MHYFRLRIFAQKKQDSHRPQTPPPALPLGVTLSSRHFLVCILVAIIRRDIMCKHDVINIQHAHCGLVGPDCKN